jgi:hypothetical protein
MQNKFLIIEQRQRLALGFARLQIHPGMEGTLFT